MNVTLVGKWVFAYMIKVRLLKWEDCPGLSEWPLHTVLNDFIGEGMGIFDKHTKAGDMKTEQRQI